MTDCVFCKIVDGKLPCDKVYEDEHVLAFRDINPQAPVHILIIPKQHIATIDDVKPEHAEVMGRLFLAAQTIAKQEGLPVDREENGYRLIMNCGRGGGQLVWHIHLHLMGGRSLGWPPG